MINSALPYLNLGCGYRYHADWTNLDFMSTGPGVIAHNLLGGIPFADESFKVVYHSHVLEHFAKPDAERFIAECYRVMAKGGIIRIAVPDLAQIVAHYQRLLALGIQQPDNAQVQADYQWIMLEMFDQCVRTTSGGEMMHYLSQEQVPNLDFVYERIGNEGRNLRTMLLAARQQAPPSAPAAPQEAPSFLEKLTFVAKHPLRFAKGKLKQYLFKEETAFFEQHKNYIALGKFRLGGEVHQWMYDQYSLGQLLSKTGFSEITVRSAHKSYIPNWAEFGLDATAEGQVHKPDSLFLEAKK